MAASLAPTLALKQALHRVGLRFGGVLAALTIVVLFSCPHAVAQTTPATQATALDGHAVVFPRDLAGRVTVLILGFGRHSQDATTAWEKPVRQQLAQPGGIGFYDIAMIGQVPGFVRPMVLRAIKHEVPDVLKPNFLALTDNEDAWRKTATYNKDQPDAAYVLLVDKLGHVQWSTHAAFTQDGFAELTRRAHSLVSSAQ